MALAKIDKWAARRVKEFQHRPAEELYDLATDPLELNNLINNPSYADIKNELSKVLDVWMLQQGDKGQETEMDAINRKVGSRNKRLKKQ